MRQSSVRLVPGFLLLLGLFCVSAPPGYLFATTGAAGNEDTFEFTNDEAEDAYDLHIEWSRAVNIKESSPFKKTSGSGSNNTAHTKGLVKQTKTASVTVTWDGTDPSINKWWWSKKDGSRLGKEKSGNPATALSQSREGLYVKTFATPEGRITVYLPDDMAAGDTISGTVVAEPKGATDDERSKNGATLEGYVIEIANVKVTPKQPSFTWVVPLTQPPQRYMLRLVEVSGHTAGSSPLPLKPVSSGVPASTHSGFTVPQLGQAGRPIEIIGPFDGNAANTTLGFGPARSTVQDFEKNTENVSGGFGLVRPLAESPRKVVFESPANVTGPIELRIKDGGVETIAPYRNVGVKLNAPKTNLLRGEHTTLEVEVNGLDGLKSDVPLQLDTRGVIQMDGGNVQKVTIHPGDIQPGGRYTTTRGITGQRAGTFTCTATIIAGLPGLSRDVKSKDELLEELNDLRERKKYDCDHGRKYQQAFAERIAVIKRVLRSFHNQKILNDPIDENCPPK